MAAKVVTETAEISVCPVISPRKNENRFWTRPEKHVWLGALFCGCTALYASRTSMPVTMVAVAKDMKWSKSESGTVLSSFFWGYTLTQVIGGYLSDRLGGDLILVTAAVGWSLFTFWTPQIISMFQDHNTTLTFLVLTRVLLGACQGVHFPGLASLSTNRLPDKERTLFYSTVSSGAHLGTIFSGSVGSFVLERFGWPAVFHVIGMFCISWTLFLKYFVMERDRKYQQMFNLKNNFSSLTMPLSRNIVPWIALFQKPAFWAMIFGHFCETNSTFILLSWLPTYFHENFPGAKGWVFNVVPWTISVPSVILGGYLAEKMIAKGFSVTFVRKLMEAISQCGKALFLLLIGYVSSFNMALFCMAMAVAAGGFHNCAIFVNPQDIAPKYAGSVFGLMNMAGAIPGFVGVYLAGHILEITNSWSAVFNITAFLNVLGCSLYIVFGTGKPIV